MKQRWPTVVVTTFFVAALILVHTGSWIVDAASMYVVVIAVLVVLSWLIGGITHRHRKGRHRKGKASNEQLDGHLKTLDGRLWDQLADSWADTMEREGGHDA